MNSPLNLPLNLPLDFHHRLLARSTTTSPSGVTGRLPYEPVEYCILAGCTAIAWAFAFELAVAAFITFPNRGGLYFWSLLISAAGCALHALGFILKFLVGAPWGLCAVFTMVGALRPPLPHASVLFDSCPRKTPAGFRLHPLPLTSMLTYGVQQAG